ncbi:hypothetical protein GCM10023194_24680 [Planotetraspora phitsanulokensis]|uniref:Secreted protein n=1 Tax=Planotetraspora phitsanulokensis TaxID=575192 RepID=A0A8J3UDC1_9ACTN|nr:hypothetical protein [Planotetraspora phitsanulokensis]GII42700.1 hypothetical protein Pph01_77030 [Planotetraspora phitsanulokensis]
MISLWSNSVSGTRTAGRLLAWVAATTAACAVAALSGSAAADAATSRHALGNPGGGDKPKYVVAPPSRWLDATIVRAFPPATGPVNFAVSANNGVPFVWDPDSAPLHWQNLRRVPGSMGGYVTNITASEDASSVLGKPILAILVRTSDSNIFFTLCNVQSPFPQAGPLPCTAWARLPA